MRAIGERMDVQLLSEEEKRALKERIRLEREAVELQHPQLRGGKHEKRRRAQMSIGHLLGTLMAQVDGKIRVLLNRLIILVNSSFAGSAVHEMLNNEKEQAIEIAVKTLESGSVFELLRALKALKNYCELIQFKGLIPQMLVGEK